MENLLREFEGCQVVDLSESSVQFDVPGFPKSAVPGVSNLVART